MKAKNIAKVYAQSLLQLGDAQSIDLAQELIVLTETINSSNDLENVLFLDVFSEEEKMSVFNEISSRLNLSKLLKHSINYLINEKRIGLLPLITKEVIIIDDERKGFLKGSIEGAGKVIDEKALSALTNYLEKKLNKKIKLDYEVNSNITAGYKVTVGDLQLDASLDSQLNRFKENILGKTI